MRNQVYTIVLISILLATALPHKIYAQDFVPTPVEISKEKVNIKGQIFYVHKVLEKQTLFSIAKTYEVSIYDLREYNPELKEKGLKTDMLLYIPVMNNAADHKSKPKKDRKENRIKEEKKTEEPAAAIVVVENVPTVDQAKDTIDTQKRDNQDKPDSQENPDKKKYKKHKVKWYEDLHEIAVKYNVTLEALCKLNGLDISDADRRPKVKYLLIPDEEYIKNMNLENLLNAQDTISVKKDIYFREQEILDNYEISLILPLNASKNTDKIQPSVSDFYSGVLLAIKDLKEKGLFDKFTLRMIDLSEYPSAGTMILSGILKNSSLIIGPFSENQLQPVAMYAKFNKIPIVSPLDINTRNLATENPFYFLFPPNSALSLDHQIQKLIKNVKDSTDNSVTVIYEKGYENSELTTKTISELDSAGIKYNTFNYNLLSGRGIDAVMIKSLNSTALNEVIITSANEAFVNDVLRNLYLIKSTHNYRIETFGINKWKNSETIDITYCHDLNLNLAISYNVDYNLPETKRFIREYKSAFNTEPSPFSYQGYDIITYFTEMLNTYGLGFPRHVSEHRVSLIQANVQFFPIAEGSGFENRALRNLRFEDGWIIRQD